MGFVLPMMILVSVVATTANADANDFCAPRKLNLLGQYAEIKDADDRLACEKRCVKWGKRCVAFMYDAPNCGIVETWGINDWTESWDPIMSFRKGSQWCPKDEFCARRKEHLLGSYAEMKPARDQTACEKRCVKWGESCVASTWSEQAKKCGLAEMNGINGWTESLSALTSFRKGSQWCPAVCYEHDTNTPGATLALFSGTQSVEDCVQKCQQNSACTRWIFGEVTKDCYLQDSKYTAVPTSNVISGPRDSIDCSGN